MAMAKRNESVKRHRRSWRRENIVWRKSMKKTTSASEMRPASSNQLKAKAEVSETAKRHSAHWRCAAETAQEKQTAGWKAAAAGGTWR